MRGLALQRRYGRGAGSGPLAPRFRLTFENGTSVVGPVQGSGGYVKHLRGAFNMLAIVKLAQDGRDTGAYEPSPGHIVVYQVDHSRRRPAQDRRCAQGRRDSLARHARGHRARGGLPVRAHALRRRYGRARHMRIGDLTNAHWYRWSVLYRGTDGRIHQEIVESTDHASAITAGKMLHPEGTGFAATKTSSRPI
jgi:hypothetical protein